MKKSNKEPSKNKSSKEDNKSSMFLEQVISLKDVLGWGAAIFVTVGTISYNLGRWMQKTDDKFEYHQKTLELNEVKTQLTLEYNNKMIELERENARLGTLLELCQGKEVQNGK